MNPKIDMTKLTPEQRDRLEQYQQTETQLQTLQDIADMTQEVINILDDYKKDKKVDNLGVLLTDIRESLSAIKDKEDPETPDFSKPVVEAVSKLDKSLVSLIKSIDFNPKIKVDAPAVNVTPPNVDLKGVEKAVAGLSKTFKEAISSITIPENDDSAVVDGLKALGEQLASIDTAVRVKPQTPETIKVTNPDGSSIGSLSGSTYYESYTDTTTDVNLVYLGKATPGSATSDAAWQIKRYNKTTGQMSFADDITTFTKVWSDRTTYTY